MMASVMLSSCENCGVVVNTRYAKRAKKIVIGWECPACKVEVEGV